ncbi:MAG: hypothetical protein WC389_22015, partial [Lutibacter sp.]
EEKIKALQSIREGIPARFALNPDKYRALYGKPNQDFYVTKDGEVVSIEDQKIFKEYFPESFVFINVSKQFPDEL